MYDDDITRELAVAAKCVVDNYGYMEGEWEELGALKKAIKKYDQQVIAHVCQFHSINCITGLEGFITSLREQGVSKENCKSFLINGMDMKAYLSANEGLEPRERELNVEDGCIYPIKEITVNTSIGPVTLYCYAWELK